MFDNQQVTPRKVATPAQVDAQAAVVTDQEAHLLELDGQGQGHPCC